MAVAHFAERYGLFVLICLGESVITIGVGVRGQPFSASLTAAAALGMLITIGMWWTYFNRSAAVAERSLREHRDPVIAAADAYSYLHLVIVAGIIVFAVGLNSLVHSPSLPLKLAPRLALCGGPVLYLLGHFAFQARIGIGPRYEKLVASIALAILFAPSGSLTAWGSAAFIAGIIAALAVAETVFDAAPDAGSNEHMVERLAQLVDGTLAIARNTLDDWAELRHGLPGDNLDDWDPELHPPDPAAARAAVQHLLPRRGARPREHPR